MTSMRWRNIECHQCKHSFRVIAYSSINTWMDPVKINELWNGTLHNYKCPQCGEVIHLAAQILISYRRGSVDIDPGDSLDVIKVKLQDAGVVDSSGRFTDNLPSAPPKRLVPPPPSVADQLASRKKNVQDLITRLNAELQETSYDGRIFELHYGPQIENIRLKLELATGAIQLDPPVATLWGEIQAIKKRRGDPNYEPD